MTDNAAGTLAKVIDMVPSRSGRAYGAFDALRGVLTRDEQPQYQRRCATLRLPTDW